MENAASAAEAPAERSGDTEPVWRFLIKPRWLGWHALMVVSFLGMLWLGDWQFHRALSGNALSWAYTFEWPLFAVFAVVFWAKTIRDEFRIRGSGGQLGAGGGVGGAGGVGGEPDLPLGIAPGNPVPVVQASTAGDGEEEDAELSAYNAYLARLNAEVKRHGRWHGLR
jgi:hypothetical protein